MVQHQESIFPLSSLRGASAVQSWLDCIDPETRDSYFIRFEMFYKWIRENSDSFGRLTPDELAEYQRGHKGYDLLDLLEAFIRGKNRHRYTYKLALNTAVRSFFLYNRSELPRDKKFLKSLEGDVPRVVRKLKVDHVRRVIERANPNYHALFLCKFQAGLDLKRILYWSHDNYDVVRRLVRRGEHPIRIDLPGRKKNKNKKPYYTYIGKDAIEALENWFDVRPNVSSNSIFLTQFDQPPLKSSIQNYWTGQLYSLGLIKRPSNWDEFSRSEKASFRTGMNIHKLRSVFKSRFRVSGSDIEVGMFFMGHDIDKLGYDESPWDNPDWFKDQYCMAESWLNIISEDPEKVSREKYNRDVKGQDQEIEELKDKYETILEMLSKYEELKKQDGR